MALRRALGRHGKIARPSPRFAATAVQATGSAPTLPATHFQPQPYTGPSAAEITEKRNKFLHPSLFLFYKKPIMLVEGQMQYVWDETGKRYLDNFAGIVTVSVGHSHPKIVEAANDQIGKLMHSTTIYLQPQIAEYAEELAKRFEGTGLDTVYFTNSGSEANDLALLMARSYTQAYDVVGLRNGYHGMSEGTRGLTALGNWRHKVPRGFGMHHALAPNQYRGPYGYDDPEAGQKYAADLRDLIAHVCPGAAGAPRLAAFFAESMQGVGGTVELPPGYLQEAYKAVREAGGLCVADEVQTGFARMGSHYWGFQMHGVDPDIVVMAKGMGNGAPLAGVITRRDIAASMGDGVHFNTYGGNPVSSAIGRAVLQAIDDDGTQKLALDRGTQYLNGLKKLQDKYEIIGDVRGKGLMLGMEIVKDRESKTPNPEAVAQIFEDTKDMGLLIGKGGLYGNVFRIKPVMAITEQDVDFALEALDLAFSRVAGGKNSH